MLSPASQQLLRDREVGNVAEFSHLDDRAVEQTVRWFDQQAGRVGPGVLVRELRNGGRKAAVKTDLLSKEAQYGRDVEAWLQQNFPDLCQPKWGSHPAAFAAVIRLHHLHGKGNLRKSTHGSVIRAAVAEWERRFEDDEQVAA